jgi:Na+:H+ antiporter, NhaC family
MSEARPQKAMTVLVAALPLIAMMGLFAVGMLFLEVGTDLLVLVMLGAAAVAGAIAKRQGHGWDDIQKATGEKLASVLPAILILLSIGMLIGTWVLSGTIPFLVYWGIELVSPRYLVVTAFLATCVMSLATGTSWGSAGTIGVALMGMAAATGAPLPLVAGAVVSGAYFGDKMSPLSDSTNISAIGAGADLYAHIRHMIYTALPSFVLSLAVYLIFGSGAAGSGPAVPESARRLLMDIDTVYGLGVLALLPPAIVVIGIARRTPAALAIAASSAVAGVVGVAVQHFTVQNALVAAVSGFDTGMLRSLGLDPSSVGANFTTLVSRGGLSSMVGTLLVVIAAFLLAGAMDVSGALETLINAMLRSVRSVFGLIAATMAAGATMISLTSHGGVTALVIGGLFQKAYDSAGLARQNLSRSIEDSVTITEPLMPWTVSAVFMATTLGVPTLSYLPWAVFCYGGPIFSLSIAALYSRTGFGILKVAPAADQPAAEQPVAVRAAAG